MRKAYAVIEADPGIRGFFPYVTPYCCLESLLEEYEEQEDSNLESVVVKLYHWTEDEFEKYCRENEIKWEGP